jgi:hypothetical protein
VVSSPLPGLRWGVKQSLRQYIVRSRGTVSFAPPASWAEDAFEFPHVDDDIDEGRQRFTSRFAGEVLFQAHGGLLQVMIADPWIEWEADEGSLSVARAQGASDRVAVGILFAPWSSWSSMTEPTAADSPVRVSMPTLLTRAGSTLLGSVYAPGTAMDPVAFAPPHPARQRDAERHSEREIS